ncbi:MAG: hypothetical protein ACYCXP_13260 [Leptospirillum sp.]
MLRESVLPFKIETDEGGNRGNHGRNSGLVNPMESAIMAGLGGNYG